MAKVVWDYDKDDGGGRHRMVELDDGRTYLVYPGGEICREPFARRVSANHMQQCRRRCTSPRIIKQILDVCSITDARMQGAS